MTRRWIGEGRARARAVVLLCAIALIPIAARAAGRDDDGHDHRFDRRHSAGRHGDRHSRGIGQHLRGGHRRARRVSPAGARRTVSADDGAAGIRHGGAPHRAARGADGGHEPADGAVRWCRSRSRWSARRRSSIPRARRSAATSIVGRCRSCRSTAATGWIWRFWRPAAVRTSRATFRRSRQGYAQINIDGQQITHLIPGTDQNQPSYSMDAIAEFVLVTNRFDATQGRSAGMLANAITKSGTNTFCRHAVRLLPQRPLQRRRLHPESRAPVLESAGERHVRRADRAGPGPLLRATTKSSASRGRSPSRARSLASTSTSWRRTVRTRAWRGSTCSSRRRRTSPRAYQNYYFDQPFGGTGGATSHPSTARRERRYSDQFFATFTQVLGNRAGQRNQGRLRALRLHARFACARGWAAASRTHRSTAAAR